LHPTNQFSSKMKMHYSRALHYGGLFHVTVEIVSNGRFSYAVSV